MPRNPIRSFQVRVNSTQKKLILVRGVEVYELDEVGAFIWQSCDGDKSVNDIAQALTTHYDVSLDQALADVAEYVDNLTDAELVE